MTPCDFSSARARDVRDACAHHPITVVVIDREQSHGVTRWKFGSTIGNLRMRTR